MLVTIRNVSVAADRVLKIEFALLEKSTDTLKGVHGAIYDHRSGKYT
jgi:hypothetical protein